MASSRGRHIRSNLNPNPQELAKDPKIIMKFRKQFDNPQTHVLERFVSFESEPIKTLDGLKFDIKFEQSMFRSKSDLDLSEVIVSIPHLNTFTPKNFYGFSKKEKCIFWDSLLEEVKGKFYFLENNKYFDPLLLLLQK